MRGVYIFHRKGAQAQAHESAAGFTVEAGSTAAKHFSSAFGKARGLCRLRENLISTGVLVDDGVVLRFTEDYEFRSPSTAAAVICGTPINGLYWRTKDGKPLKEVTATTPL